MEEEELPWPQKGDQLFQAGDDWWLSSYIQPWNKDFHAYASGYRQAADIVVEHVTASDIEHRSTRDYVVFPVVFLYRHYAELRLKEIIMVGNRLYGIPQGLPQHHRIDELWRQARSILSETSSRDDLDNVERCIAEFSQMDPGSDSFRYPITRDGKLSISQDHLVISLRNLRDVMTRLGSFLDASSDHLIILYEEQKSVEGY